MASFIVFKENADGAWAPITTEAVESVTADAAIELARQSAGTFVAVLVRGFRPRTLFAPPKPAATPTRETT